jgi:hypothetical protein
MKTSRLTLMLVATAAALGGCNAPDANRTTKAPPGIDKPTAVVEPLVSRSAPPAPAERGPIPPHSNTVAPGTDATVAFAGEPTARPASAPSPVSSPTTGPAQVSAQQTADAAPDTASADAAKAAAAKAAGDSAGMPGTARDTATNNPRNGTLTKDEESTQMPKAGQVNNHSSTSLETDSGKGSKP